MGLSFPLLCWLFLALFLGTLGGFALAVTRTVAPADSSGKGHTRGCLGGCGALLALIFLCGLGIVGLGASLVVTAVGSAVELNPVRKIEIRRSAAEDEPATGALVPERILGDEFAEDGEPGAGPVHALFTVKGDAGRELVDLMRRFAGIDASELEDFLSVHHRAGSDGSAYDIYEFRLPVSALDLERFEHDLERELDGLELRLPESIEIEFEGAEQFY